LNPLVSEINYPINGQMKLKVLDKFFDPLYKSLRQIFIENERPSEIRGILEKNIDLWNRFPHFNMINNSENMKHELSGGKQLVKLETSIINTLNILMGGGSMSEELKKYIMNSVIKFNGVDTEEEFKKLDSDLVYSLYNFMNESSSSLFKLINTQNYGVCDDFYMKNIVDNIISCLENIDMMQDVNMIRTDFSIYYVKNYSNFIKIDSIKNNHERELLIKFIADSIPEVVTQINKLPLEVKSDKIKFYRKIDIIVKNILYMNHHINYDETKNIVVPYVYNDVPNKKSQFTNPLLTLALTILSYIIGKPTINNVRNNIMVKTILSLKKKLSGIPRSLLDKTVVYKEYKSANLSVNIDDLENMNKLSEKDIEKLFRNEYFLGKYLKHIVYEEINVNVEQLNISGVDIVLSGNIKKKSGFTGTPSIPKFAELDDSQTMIVKPEEQNTIDTFNTAIMQSKIVIVPEKESKLFLYDVFDNLPEGTIDKTYTLIDIGGVLNGMTPKDVYELVKIKVNKINKFIYWDMEHKPMSIYNDIVQQWDQSENGDNFFYYDNQHITGIDAKIKLGTFGICLLGKNSRKRDVGQGMFRMRKLAKSDDFDNRHTIIFALSEKISKLISVDNVDIGVTNKDIQRWFESQEENTIKSQTNIMKIQNLRSTSRIFRQTDQFKILNDFIYPDIALLSQKYGKDIASKIMVADTKYSDLELMDLHDLFKRNGYEEFYVKMKPDSVDTHQSQSQSQCQQQQQQQQQQQEINKLILSKIPKKNKDFVFKYIDNRIKFESFEDYVNTSKYNKYESYFGQENIFFKDNMKNSEPPFGIIFYENNIFVILLSETLKYISYLRKNPKNVNIYDTIGANLYGNIRENESVICKLIAKIFIPDTYISLNDYIIIISKLSSNNIIYKILMNFIKNTHEELIEDKFKIFLELYNNIYDNMRIEIIDILEKYNKLDFDSDDCIQITENFISAYKDNKNIEIIKNIIHFFTGNIVCYKIEPFSRKDNPVEMVRSEMKQSGMTQDVKYKYKYLKYKQKYMNLKNLAPS